MLIREEVLRVLRKHLAGSPAAAKIESIAEEIAGLGEGWEELPLEEHKDELGFTIRQECSDICYLAEKLEKADAVRIFRRVK